jgi:DNA helicase-2/ATP-dependent DNA helicase PcrA
MNPQEIDAIKHLNGPALVVAGPGSGKTRVLTYRVANLIQNHGISESNILCVTFTNKAAEEIRQRVEILLSSPKSTSVSSGRALDGLSPARAQPGVGRPVGGTFHSVCSKNFRKMDTISGFLPRLSFTTPKIPRPNKIHHKRFWN